MTPQGVKRFIGYFLTRLCFAESMRTCYNDNHINSQTLKVVFHLF